MDTRKEKRRARREAKLMRKYDTEHDIRYRGPLSYQSFKILGWLCIAMLQVVLVLELGTKLDPLMAEDMFVPTTVLRLLSNMALPFFLISNFSLILNAKDGYKRQLLMYASFSLGIVAVSVFGYRRYALGIAGLIAEEGQTPSAFLAEAFYSGSESGYVSYNLFIDLFLCALLIFFLSYRPQRVFTGKKLALFRAFAVLPIVYEIACIVLKSLSVERMIKLPFIVFPFLTVKPSMTFLVFIILAFYIKRRECRFLKTGRTPEEYEQFLKTKRNSFQFSRFTAIILAIIGVLDVIAMLFAGYIIQALNQWTEISFEYVSAHLNALGVGQSLALLLLAPLMLLFSYTRTPKLRILDSFIPIIGVALIALVYLEGGYQLLLMLPNSLSSLDTGGLGLLGGMMTP